MRKRNTFGPKANTLLQTMTVQQPLVVLNLHYCPTDCQLTFPILQTQSPQMQDPTRIKVELVDHDDGFMFNIRKNDRDDAEPVDLDEFTAEAFKEYGDIFTEGLSLNNAANEQSITAAITNVSDLLKMVLENYESDCSSFKCILASSISNSDGIDFISRDHKIPKDIFAENYVILAVKIFAAMRKTKAGNANGSNIYRLVHCIVNQGGNSNKFYPYAYAIFTIFLQACMFSYVFCHSLLNMPGHKESMTNLPLALLVFIYQFLLLLPEVRDTLAVGSSGFWDSGSYSLLRFFDVVSNIIMPVILLPIGIMLVLTADNLLEAVLSSTAVLFIPTLDNDIINLMGESDQDTVKKHVAQESIHEIADHFFRFQIAYEESDGFSDLEHNYSETNSLTNRVNMHHCRQDLTITVPTTNMVDTDIAEPVLCDLALTGSQALMRCVVFDAFCTTRSLEHLHSNAPNSRAVTPMGAGKTKGKGNRDGFSEIPRDSYQEVFFSESAIISPNSLFTKMEYKIDDKAPYAILYLKLWRLGGSSQTNTVEYRTKRFSDLYPTRRIEPGCFIITNIGITDCIDTLRLCWAPTAKGLLKAMEYYTIFNCDDAAESAMKMDQVTTQYKSAARANTPTRRTSLLSQQVQNYQSV